MKLSIFGKVFPQSSSNLNDTDVLTGVLSGDRCAAREFVEQYGGIVQAAVLSVRPGTGVSSREDLFMDCMVHIFNNDMAVLRRFKGRSRLSTYLYMVSRRLALDVLGYDTRRSAVIDAAVDPALLPAQSAETDILYTEKVQKAWALAVSACDPQTRVFIKMAFVDECSTDELRSFFGWGSDTTVYTKKNKVAEKLRKAIRKTLESLGGVK